MDRAVCVLCSLLVAGCMSARPLPLRTDPTVSPTSNWLAGLRVAEETFGSVRIRLLRDGLAEALAAVPAQPAPLPPEPGPTARR